MPDRYRAVPIAPTIPIVTLANAHARLPPTTNRMTSRGRAPSAHEHADFVGPPHYCVTHYSGDSNCSQSQRMESKGSEQHGSKTA